MIWRVQRRRVRLKAFNTLLELLDVHDQGSHRIPDRIRQQAMFQVGRCGTQARMAARHHLSRYPYHHRIRPAPT